MSTTGIIMWVPVLFKGTKVFAAADESGNLIISQGKVEIKYSQSDTAKIYNALRRNIQMPTEGQNESRASKETSQNSSENKPKSKPKTTKSKSSTSTKTSHDELVWQNPVGETITSHDEPEALKRLARPLSGIWEVYTDGACSGNPGPCGAGVVIRTKTSYTEISQYIGVGTNNIAEIYAILLVLRLAKEQPKKERPQIIIHTDSELAIGLLGKNWKAKSNTKLISVTKDAMLGLNVTMKKVKGHAGIPQNERADEIAVAAVSQKK